MVDPDVLRDLFDRATSLPPRERAAFLATACGQNVSLRAEVERLLAADAGAASLFAAEPGTATSDPSARSGERAPSAPLSPGTRLGVYAIETLVGAGGMGEVYRARDTRLGRTVAVKVLPLALSSDSVARHRFEREARAIAALSHPHICPLFDIGREADRDYLVMEYLHGETLAARLRAGPLPLSEALAIAIEVASALSTAHRSGIIHRDLKPANVMLTEAGVRLLDFGLARHTEHDGRRRLTTLDPLTGTGVILGTLPYMAPEQLDGRPADARTDVFSFGAALYEMVTGRRAFEGATDASVIGNILHADPAAPSTLAPATPKQLDVIVRKCLAKDPADRPATMAELHAQLLTMREEALPRAGARHRSSWPSSTRGIVLAGAVALLVGTAVVAWRWARGTANDRAPRTAAAGSSNAVVALPTPRTVPLTTLRGAEDSPTFSPDGKQVAFAWSPPPGTESRIVVKRIGDDGVLELTQGAMDGTPAWSPDGRLIAFARNACPFEGETGDQTLRGLYVVPPLGGPARRLYSGWICGGPAWSPDGRTLVFSRGDSKLVVLSLETLGMRSIPAAGAWTWRPTFSPDGKTLAFMAVEPGGADIYVVPTDGGTPKRLTFDNTGIGGLAWSTDGKAILYSSSRNGSSELWRMSTAGGPSERVPVAADGPIALDRSGRQLAWVQGHGGQMQIAAIKLNDARATPIVLAPSSRRDHSPTFSKDGRRIAFTSDRGGNRNDVWIADADGANPIRLTSFETGFTGSPQFSPDGEWVAFDAIVDDQLDVLTVRTAGGAPRRLTPPGSNEFFPTWSRDGRWIYFASNRTGREQVWKMPVDGGDAIQLTKDGGSSGFESSDGTFLIYGKGNAEPGIWRIPLQGGREELVLAADPSGPYARDWTLVGNRLYYLKSRNPDRQSLEFLEVSARQIKRVLDLPKRVCPSYSPDLAISPDHRTMLTCFEEPSESDIMLVENFH